jgi:hypothetical protein
MMDQSRARGASATRKVAPVDVAPSHGASDMVGVDHPPVAQIDRNVMDRPIEEQEVPRLQVPAADVLRALMLLKRVVWQDHSDLAPGPHREAGAIEPVTRICSAPPIARPDDALGASDHGLSLSSRTCRSAWCDEDDAAHQEHKREVLQQWISPPWSRPVLGRSDSVRSWLAITPPQDLFPEPKSEPLGLSNRPTTRHRPCDSQMLEFMVAVILGYPALSRTGTS